jgi:hypothetical protein
VQDKRGGTFGIGAIKKFVPQVSSI